MNPSAELSVPEPVSSESTDIYSSDSDDGVLSISLLLELCDLTTYIDHIAADNDLFDDSTNGLELGILLHTDYFDKGAWQSFLARLQDGEKELVENATSVTQPDSPVDPTNTPTQAQTSSEPEGSDSESDDEFKLSIFAIVNPTSPQDRHTLSGLSNLIALRLLNDVDVRTRPVRPAATPRVITPNRLIDYGGWQEINVDKPVWIYDSQLNSDQSVRVVSQQEDVYGTAT